CSLGKAVDGEGRGAAGKMMGAMRVAALVVLLWSIAAAAQTNAPAGASGAAACSAPAGWPTAQVTAAKDPSVVKSCQILTDMIRALGGDAYLNLRDMQSEGRTY